MRLWAISLNHTNIKRKKKKKKEYNLVEREAETKHTQSVGQNLQTFVVGGRKK
jgi:hypothetical protein